MAQGLLSAAVPAMRVTSAGTGALVGMPADETAVRLMQGRGIDISRHRATQITRTACMQADMVLVMDTAQRRQLEERYPQACGRIFRLGEFSKGDIPDPYRKPEKNFRDALRLIDDGIGEWLHRLQRI